MGLFKCDKCKQYGLYFDRNYSPDQFLEGKANSLIWIIGLNPKGKEGTNDDRTLEKLQTYFEDKQMIHPYFRDFKKVSARLYDLLGKNHGVAHTDLVKCFSNNFPPRNCGSAATMEIINNCKWYLMEQLRKHKPKMLICNGSAVCKCMLEVLPPTHKSEGLPTAYLTSINKNKIVVILSGFVGRIDDYAKRRLGREIEYYMEQLNIGMHLV